MHSSYQIPFKRNDNACLYLSEIVRIASLYQTHDMPCIFHCFEISAFRRFDFNDVRIPRRHHPLSSEQARNSAVGQKECWATLLLPSFSGFLRMPRTSFCLLVPPGSPNHSFFSIHTTFLLTLHRNRSLARADSFSAPRCFDTNYMKSDTGGWRKGEENPNPPFPGGLTTQERQERLMLSSTVAGPFFLHRYKSSLFLSYPLFSRRSSHSSVCDTDHFCNIAERSARWIWTVSFFLSIPWWFIKTSKWALHEDVSMYVWIVLS